MCIRRRCFQNSASCLRTLRRSCSPTAIGITWDVSAAYPNARICIRRTELTWARGRWYVGEDGRIAGSWARVEKQGRAVILDNDPFRASDGSCSQKPAFTPREARLSRSNRTPGFNADGRRGLHLRQSDRGDAGPRAQYEHGSGRPASEAYEGQRPYPAQPGARTRAEDLLSSGDYGFTKITDRIVRLL